MRAVVLDPPTVGLDEALERRRRSGLDRLDEVWEGVLHMVAAPSCGEYRPIQHSTLIELGAGELAKRIDWP